MIVTIHQPEFMPWLGLLDKISRTQKFIVLDNVQFRKNYFQNRNKIRVNSEQGWQWITVPVSFHFGSLIKEVKIVKQNWQHKMLRSIEQNYRKAKYFKLYYPELESIISNKYSFLIDLNMELIKFALDKFKIGAEVVFASSLGATDSKSDFILDCCKKAGATIYISGISGKDYLIESDFENAGIKIEYQQFSHPVYKQLYEPFIPCISFIDLLFNEPPETLYNSIIRLEKLLNSEAPHF